MNSNPQRRNLYTYSDFIFKYYCVIRLMRHTSEYWVTDYPARETQNLKQLKSNSNAEHNLEILSELR